MDGALDTQLSYIVCMCICNKRPLKKGDISKKGSYPTTTPQVNSDERQLLETSIVPHLGSAVERPPNVYKYTGHSRDFLTFLIFST